MYLPQQTSGDPDQRVQQAEFLMKQWLAGQEGKLGGQHLNSTGLRSPWERQLSPPSGCERWNNLSRSKGKLERDGGGKSSELGISQSSRI